ncbi:MAG: PQQ-dependent sugar dehydrogenase [Nitrospirae bacterium]|nr:MAG: PQQ-dependent sugar dehydrogenase [Nitrospirota bacterium]
MRRIKSSISILLIASLWWPAFVQPAFCFPSVGGAPQAVKDVFLRDGDAVRVEKWIENLEIPWSLVFLPDGRALVSERAGRIRLIIKGKLQQKPYAIIDVAHIGEGGLMGLALHPEFPEKPFIYAMHTYEKEDYLYNRVIRLKDLGDKAVFDKIIIDGIPGGSNHDGGRIAFGPDGMLYITTGETFKSELAQRLNSLGGKILRITAEGGIPPDNPFKGSPIYSYGHRNPQGIAWNQDGVLFSSEHGPSGEYLLFANDEINIIKKGGNYGWPEAVGAPGKSPYIDPLISWKKTTPPSGIAFYKCDKINHLKGDLFVATLKSESLIRIRLKREDGNYKVIKIERWFAENYKDGKYGRIRDVVEGPDGFLYFLTNNRDGRGSPRPGDDKIYRIMPL